MPPQHTSMTPPGSRAVSPTVDLDASPTDRLRHRVDELAQQLLGARDAAVGAEAELGVAKGRMAELEQRVHVLTVENEELRAALDRSEGRPLARLGGEAARTAVVQGDRVARGLARRVADSAGRRLGR